MPIVILNGPAGCGKGIAYAAIRAVHNAGDGRIKKKLHEIASALWGVPLDLWDQREGKEEPHPKLTLAREELMGLAGPVKIPHAQLVHALNVPKGALVQISPRQALIYVSEVICKPAFGADYFGRERAERVAGGGLWCCESGGFLEEITPLPPEEVCLIRVRGRGEFGPDDTRSYLTVPGVRTVDIDNSGDPEDYLRAVLAEVDRFLAGR